MEDWVFVDTCIWASFFTRPTSREKLAVDVLLAQDRVALVGPVVAEVLRGFRRQEQADWAGSRLRLAHYATADWDDWRHAAHLAREQAGLGRDLPITEAELPQLEPIGICNSGGSGIARTKIALIFHLNFISPAPED